MSRQALIKQIGCPAPRQILIVTDQDTTDIMRQMAAKHKKCAKYYDKIAENFNYASTLEVCESIFDFCKKEIRYSEESADEQFISSPQTILARGCCDCKGYALFTAGILDALNRAGRRINWTYRFVSYKPFDRVPGHVFVVVTLSDGTEVWIDPVLPSFDEKRPYCWEKDMRVRAKTAAVTGCGCGCESTLVTAGQIGATGQQTGQVIMKVAPVLAYVPVVGWIAAAAGEVVGFFLVCFGSKYTQSTGVRWLTAFYEYYTLGGKKVSDNNVNAANIVPSQNWFAAVTGVPVYDKYRIHALMGTDPEGTKSLGLTQAERAQKYLSFWDAQKAGITYPEALAAVMRVDQLNMKWTDPAGAWHDFTAAPATIDSSAAVTNTGDVYGVAPNGNVTVNGLDASVAGVEQKQIIILAAAAAAAILILN